MIWLECLQDLPHFNPNRLSVTVETRVQIWSGPNPNAAFSQPQWYSRWNLILIGKLVSEIFKLESFTDGRHTDGRRLESYPFGSPGAFGSGELKKYVSCQCSQLGVGDDCHAMVVRYNFLCILFYTFSFWLNIQHHNFLLSLICCFDLLSSLLHPFQLFQFKVKVR